ncbi:hypothetical protein [Helicobacter fennelliae]|nr:hypothetical protein [Helicobacter fennelliae]
MDCHSPKGLRNDDKNDIDSTRIYADTSEHKKRESRIYVNMKIRF